MEQYGTTMPDNYLTNTEKPTVSHNNDPRGHAYTISNTVAVAWNDNNEEENLQRIITQKWIANYPLGLEAWAEYRNHSNYQQGVSYLKNGGPDNEATDLSWGKTN